MEKSIIIKTGRERSLRRLHPWIFSGAIHSVIGSPVSGDTVEVLSSDQRFLGRGAFSPQSQITVRMWNYNADEPIDERFFANRLQRAIDFRKELLSDPKTTAFRLVNAESDGLPGLIIDKYGDFLICQFLTAGVEKWKKEIVAQLNALISNAGIYERSDVEVREKEGLPLVAGVLMGIEPPNLVEILENGLKFLVDVKTGHKTGFYLDQRENRKLIGNYAANVEMLNCFSYTGGFGIFALKNGAAHVTNIDASTAALEIGLENAKRNELPAEHIENVAGDVFQVLREYRNANRMFDLIVLDPPKFAETKSNLEHAARGYKDINLLAFKLLRKNGILFTFSCSGLMTPELFQKIIADAALDAKRDSQILRRLTQAPDHPTALAFPEGTYLKGFVCRAE
ncbi:MAG: class I SAM-dependent methyltransferase [Candidatus Marinimicrobia bacterium]|nr:class I SAM-dependent methyltransferase [Candidatus Neomarinimicrobiota bacterium]